MADKQIQELRVRNDHICEELGLPKFQRDEQKCSRGMSNAEYYTADRGESWKFELMRVIDECMRCAGSCEEFLILLRSEGYDATWTDSRKNITCVMPDGRKCRDSKLHIEKYLKENMEAEFGYRTENDNTRNVDAAQKADGRGTTAGTQRDGHGAELERAARNAGQAVPAADAAGRRPENVPDKAGSAGKPLTAMQASATEFAGQAGSLSAGYSSACKELTESTKTALNTVTKETNQRLSNMTQAAKKKICLCAWISTAAVTLCAALCALAVLWSR